MPGTTRYSATFDRTYEEEDRIDPSPPTTTRRSRSLSLQANSAFDGGRPYTPLGGRPPLQQRSSSTDNGPAKGLEHIPTRTAKTTVKAHNNPFQFVKVGTCPLYIKAEEQLKKAKEVKKPDVLKEEEEEWQSNLDSWKSRRRKMSEDVIRRQEEIKQFELEEQEAQAAQKKTKTFSEMVNSRATRGRALSLCLISSPLEFQDWEYENKTHKNGSCSFTDDSEGNSTVNSDDEGVSFRGRLGKVSQNDSEINHRTNGDTHMEQNSSKLETQNGDYKKLSDLSTNSVQMKPKENSYIDSGLESISSSHRAGDTPDSGSDFSPDSNSSIDCDSPRTGVNILEEFTSKTSQLSQGYEITVNMIVKEKGQDFGFTFLGGKDEGQVLIASIVEGSKAETSGVQLGDRIISIDGSDVSCKKHIEIVAMVQKGREKGEISLLLWRHSKSSESTNGFKTVEKQTAKPNKSENQVAKPYEKSVESENEMYVDDYEDLQRQTELLASSIKIEKTITNAQAQTNGNKSPTFDRNGISLKISAESLPAAPKLKETNSNGAVEEPNKNEKNANAEQNSESPKKNVVKVKRIRRKGVYALNVPSDSNQIPQEGISTNSLFPLSPVTELPSPAEETKTISSALSRNSTATSNSHNKVIPKEELEEAEVKTSSAKENTKILETPLKTERPLPPNELKISSSEKVENKTESATVPVSPTKNKVRIISPENVQNEKPKTAKKVRVKVKKAADSETASASSPTIKEGPTSPGIISVKSSDGKEVPISPVTVPAESLIVKERPSGTIVVSTKSPNVIRPINSFSTFTNSSNVKEGSSSTVVASAKSPIVKEGSTCTVVSPAISSDMKAGPTSSIVTSEKSPDVKEGPTDTVVTSVISPSVKEESSIPIASSSKSSNLKEGSTCTVVTSAISSDVKAGPPGSIAVSVKSLNIKEGPSSPVTAPKYSNAKKGPSCTVVTSAISPNVKEGPTSPVDVSTKSINVKEVPTSTVIIPANSPNVKGVPTSPVTASAKSLKMKESSPNGVTSSASSLHAEEGSTNIITTPQDVKESPAIPVTAAPVKIVKKVKAKESKSRAKMDTTEGKLTTEVENKVSSVIKESGIISSGTNAITPTTEAITSKNKIPDHISNDTSYQSEEIVPKKETSNLSPSVIANNKKSMISTPVTPEGDKPKPVMQKKIRVKTKGNKVEQKPPDSSQMDKESTASVSNTLESSAKITLKVNEQTKEQTSTSVAQDKQVKIPTKIENAVQNRENDNPANGISSALSDEKSAATKDKNPEMSAPTKKTRNLKLKIDVKTEVTNGSSPSPSTPKVAKSTKKSPKTPQGEKSKPVFTQKKEIAKQKENRTEQILSGPSEVPKEAFNAAGSSSNLDSSSNISSKESQLNKDKQSFPLIQDQQIKMVTKTENPLSSQIRENGVHSTGIASDTISATTKGKNSTASTSPGKKTNLTLKIDSKAESTNLSPLSSPVTNAKPPKTPPKTPQNEKSKPMLAQKKEITSPKGKGYLSLETAAVTTNTDKNESRKSPSANVSSYNIVNNNTSIASNKKVEIVNNNSTETGVVKSNSVTVSAANSEDEKAKPPSGKKTKNRSRRKNTNNQKVNIPAKQNEEIKSLNADSLNIVFQSQPKNSQFENQPNVVKNYEMSGQKAVSSDLVADVPPVEKVAEEMEKLILEQLEEEERAKELFVGMKSTLGSPDHLLTAPPKLAEPPKEKPPPPPSPSEGNPKEIPLKRVNSTKRIKKEIHKRRSNFLGIDNADESVGNSEPSIPPPPALEEILKAEMELDRQSRLKIESAATERLTLEEKEIMLKEREIIESLESEERRRQLLNGTDDMASVIPDSPRDVISEQERIESLKNERKRIETERLLTDEEQQMRLLEEKQLREREEFIRKQEANKQAVPLSDPLLSVTANAVNTSKPVLSSSSETISNVSLSGASGDGKNLTNSAKTSESKSSSECDEKNKVQKPAVPPKPLKKKEAIRKERERLRQEQEALQRERDEHRRKLILEQEELIKHQKSHAPEAAPVSRLGPLPPLVQPNLPPQLTSTMNATPTARESASFPSRSHHGTPNGTAGSSNAAELMAPPVVRQNRLPAPRKAVQNEAWGQQKMPSVRKQNHDSLTENRYNQNHWLIQEAEMRRISELKERQRAAACSQTHLAEDDVCSSNPPRVPVIPHNNPHLNSYAAQDKMWNYGQSNMPLKKYPPPVVKEPLHTIYPRETVQSQPPSKPSRVVPMERQEQMLSVSGRKRCSHCNEELGRGAAMIIESLQLYYHIHCFQCCVCQAQLGNGSCGTDVRVRNNKLHCHNCYSNDEAGLKFSQV